MSKLLRVLHGSHLYCSRHYVRRITTTGLLINQEIQMNYLRSHARHLIERLGYRIIKLDGRDPTEKQFKDLSIAYENKLRTEGMLIPQNGDRYRLLLRLAGTSAPQAYYIVDALARTCNILGDICEFGVAQGLTSALIANEIISCSKKRLHLFDSFEGLPTPTAKDQLKDDIFFLGSIEAYAGTMACPESMVREQLDRMKFPRSRISIHHGFFEDIISARPSKLPDAVSFAYVDFDFYLPIKQVLSYLDEVTSRGSIIIVDDYDHFSTGAKTAVDEFINSASHRNDYSIVVPDSSYGKFAILSRVS